MCGVEKDRHKYWPIIIYRWGRRGKAGKRRKSAGSSWKGSGIDHFRLC